MANNSKRILVVDDEPKIVEVLKSYLESGGYKVYEANTGRQALEAFEKFSPSLIVLDLMLPDRSGEEICRTLRQKSKVPILMLTAKVEEEDILKGLGIGADDYVTKPFSPRQLVARIEAILRRTADDDSLLSEVASFNEDELVIDYKKHIVKKNAVEVNITPSEYKILTALSRFPKKAFTREELIPLVYDDDFEGFDRTIDSHIKNLRQKIEEDPRNPRYILTVYGVGYRFGGD